MLPVEHRAKLYRNIRGSRKYPLHTTINRRPRNGWTTEIQKCHRLTPRQFEESTQRQRDKTVQWEQLQYEYRIVWTREGTKILKQRSPEYSRPQTDDTM